MSFLCEGVCVLDLLDWGAGEGLDTDFIIVTLEGVVGPNRM